MYEQRRYHRNDFHETSRGRKLPLKKKSADFCYLHTCFQSLDGLTCNFGQEPESVGVTHPTNP